VQTRAQLVIVGAGIVGCSTAYHLAKLGWRDIVVIDQGPLFATGGSTSHAPGLVFQTNASQMMSEFAKYSVSLYGQLATAEGPAYYPVGGIEVATTPERLDELARKSGLAKSWGIRGHLLTPEETVAKLPLIDPNQILGAFYVPDDGIAKALRASEALANEAIACGAATFHGRTLVTDIETTDGQVAAVVTDRGRIATDRVLVCAGIWGPRVGRMVGEVLPMHPVQHQYVKTAPLPVLTGARAEVEHPILRHQDRSMYFRQHGDCYGIGSYRHEPLLVAADDILSPAAAPVMPSVKPFTPEHFAPAWEAAVELLPAIATASDLPYKINGMMSFTPDGFPLIGESSQARGFWVAEAVWVTHGGGVGKAVSELLTAGVTSTDIHEADLHRFPACTKNRAYIQASCAQQYREVYDIIHPLDEQQHTRNLRLSPAHPRLRELGATFGVSAHWERPTWFAANAKLLNTYDVPGRTGWEVRHWSPIAGAEHQAVRDRAGVFDLTPFAKFEVSGPGALAYLQYLAANDIDRPVGKVTYTSLLDATGGIVCDLTVTRLGRDRFWIVTGAGVAGHDWAWLQQHLPSDGSVRLEDRSAAFCCFGLWGPRSRAILQNLADRDVSMTAFPRYWAREFDLGSIPVRALSVSYVGEVGWELYAPVECGLALWDLLWETGQPRGLVAAGTAAFDTLRLEKGYLLWGADIHPDYTPYEAGLDFTVKLDKGDFLGRDALLQQQDRTPTRKLCYLTLNDPDAVILGKEPVLNADGEAIAAVTSAGYGYSLGRCVAYAYLPEKYALPGSEVSVEYFGRALPATVVQHPSLARSQPVAVGVAMR